MKTLNLKIQDNLGIKPQILIDGFVVHYKRNKYGNIDVTHQTNKDSVEVSIQNTLEIMGPCWWLVQMAFFIFSIFGIFNPKLSKLCYDINFKAQIALSSDINNVKLEINQESQQFGTSNQNVTILENTCSLNQTAQKRKKILKISKIFAWLILVAVIILVLVIKQKGE